MDATLGAKLAEGASSEVFAWGERRVVKLFRPEYAQGVEREARSAAAVTRAGIACPAVHGVVEVDGRRGVVFDRVDGPTLLGQLLQGERSPASVGRALADVHLAMHAVDVPELPDLAAAGRERGLDLPPGSILFHGDFHPGNVVVAPDGPCTIDWINAHRAPRAADVARTVMAVRYQGLSATQCAAALDRERRARARILDAYLASYVAARPDVSYDLPGWLRRAAASLLRSEPTSADDADLHALVAGDVDAVTEPALAHLPSPER